MPELYWYDSKLAKPFIPMKPFFRFYYHLARNSPVQKVTPFPKGLRMMGGSVNTRTAQAIKIVKVSCQVNKNLSTPLECDGFKCGRDCPFGLRVEVFLPQCWDGINLWLPNSAHVTYPAATAGLFIPRDGNCPWTHPIRIPQIMFEGTWDTNNVAPGVTVDNHLIWSFGDMTGYGAHGDFVNGWDMDVLSAALNASGTCVDIGAELPFEDCPIFRASHNIAAGKACTPPVAGELKEPTGQADYVALSALPGCNPIWAATGPKPTCNPPVPGLTLQPSLLGTMGPTVAPTPDPRLWNPPTAPGWYPVECFISQSEFDTTKWFDFIDQNLTVDRCQTACIANGYTYASVSRRGANTWKCSCGNGILPTALVYPGMCTLHCPGNSSQLCGGDNAVQVWWAGSKPAAPRMDQFNAGCLVTTPKGLLSRATYSYTSVGMTTATCTQACFDKKANWALIRAGLYCSCGNDTSLYDGGIVPDSYCNVPCRGNATEMCGSSGYGQFFNITGVDLSKGDIVRDPGLQGCYARPSSGLAVTGGVSFVSNVMTTNMCKDGCYELGATYAAVTGTVTCICGSTLNLGQDLPDSECNVKCPGNTTQWCGSSGAVDLYLSSASTLSIAQLNASHYPGWIGCYSGSAAAMPFSDYTFSDPKMTPATCIAGCAQFNYLYAGTQGTNCYCGKAAPATPRYPAPTFCKAACPGNNTLTCGGSGYVDIWPVTKPTTTSATPSSTSASASTTASSTSSAAPSASASGALTGCYSDTTGKGLTGGTWKFTALTVEACTSGCKELGFSFAGLWAGNTCNCGNAWAGTGGTLPASSCSSACNGNAAQKCGGPQAQSVYSTAGVGAPVKPKGWVGCYADTATHILPTVLYGNNYLTPALCQSECFNLGATYAGLLNGRYCYCGPALTGAVRALSALCTTTPCTGDATQSCGGAQYMDIYTPALSANNGVKGFIGCYFDGNTVINKVYLPSSAMTIENCAQYCSAAGYSLMALRTPGICNCGSGMPTQMVPDAVCMTGACNGNSAQFCGSSTNAASAVYNISLTGVSASIVPKPNAQGFVGCFRKGTDFPLTTQVLNAATITNAVCAKTCAEAGYKYAGTSSGRICFCGNSLVSTTLSYPVANTECNSPCPGDSTTTCGTGVSMSIWDTTITNPATPGGGSNTPTDPTSKGCFTNSATLFANAGYQVNASYVDITYCKRTCNVRGFTTAGINYGGNCACTNSTSNYGVAAPAAGCTTPCRHNASEICGGSGTFVSIFDATKPSTNTSVGFAPGYVGCFGNDPSLGPQVLVSRAMSTDMCRNACAGQGSSVFSVFLYYCYCAPSLPTSLMLPDELCNSGCGGNPDEFCGFSGRVSTFWVNPPGQPKIAAMAAPLPISAASSSPASSSAPAASSSAAPSTSSDAASSTPASAPAPAPTSAAPTTTTAAPTTTPSATSAAPTSASAAATTTTAKAQRRRGHFKL